MAGFRAPQREVKHVLKEINELDKHAVKSYLAKKSGQRSQSTIMRKNWEMGRKEIQKILAHLAEDGMMQTTFGNLMGAIRLKASKQGKMWHAV